uniref:B30.2/SPRY domain-containing protein n=1 Tax=Sphaeramia orbicularis TaxID=375764 RepID=A0A672ZIP9_9TELE
MDQCEDREEGAPPPKTTDRTPSGPGPDRPPKAQRPGPGPGPSCVSMNSDDSMGVPQNQAEQQSSEVPSDPRRPSQPDSTCEETQMAALKESLLKILEDLADGDFETFKWFLRNELSIPVSKLENAKRTDTVDLMVQTYYPNTQTVTVRVLQKMDRTDLVQKLSKGILSKESIDQCQRKLKVKLKEKFECVFEGIAKAGHPKTLLNQIYSELYITEGEATEVNQDHEVRQIETASRNPHRPPTTITCKDIFKTPPDRRQPIRTVLTKGVAGVGKTVSTQKFSLDWAEDKANQDIHFIFPLTFRQLNVLKQKKFSLVELLHHFFTETKEAGIRIFADHQVVFILDGLDECRPPLDFNNTQILTDVTESTSVDVLLMNLIRGNLLPSARLWITTRPAAANQIPEEYHGMVTEVRGFTDPQKDEYFRKRFTDKRQTNTIISHIKRSRSVHIMCHIPVFCLITARVLEDVLKTTDRGKLPKTLTEMYIHFLVIQAKVKNVKYDGKSGRDLPWSPETRKMIESLGKLAFEQLKKGNLIFSESDLTECGIDISSASVYSGVFTEVFKEESGGYENKVFCFIHLSVQEFLAALHVHQTFINTGVNLLSEQTSVWSKLSKVKPVQLYQTAVDQALQSPNGHLDLFLRFLLGLSLQTNQSLLHGLVKETGSSSKTNQKTVEYIKKKISKNVSAERSINLFHCLNELEDRSLVDQIQQYLRSGRLSTKQLSPAQWSALAFILLSSEKDLDVFDLKEYSGSEEVLLRLLPVVKASNKALLRGCNLSDRSCEALSSVLRSQSCSLTHVDLSSNDLKDSGVKILSNRLKSPGCRLDTLRLSGCLITEEGCSSLVSALQSNPSHLRQLDLSYNHPGASGQELCALVEDPHWRLDTVRLDPAGVQMLKPGPWRYFCELTLDPNTANRKLKLSENNKKVERVEEVQSYPDHQDRFDFWEQVMSSTGLTGRCYWEVQWSGWVWISVTYRGIRRKGDSLDCVFGLNDQSWSLSCGRGRYSVRHKGKYTFLPQSSSSSSSSSSLPSGTVSVYVDCPAGSVSFYTVCSDKLIHLHTFKTTFTEPLFGGFRLWPGSTVYLCGV